MFHRGDISDKLIYFINTVFQFKFPVQKKYYSEGYAGEYKQFCWK